MQRFFLKIVKQNGFSMSAIISFCFPFLSFFAIKQKSVEKNLINFNLFLNLLTNPGKKYYENGLLDDLKKIFYGK